MEEKTIYTIGYGDRNIDDFIDLLKKYQIEFLIDVRSFPYSKLKPHYNKSPLEAISKKNNITYSFWGKSLGGRPENEDLYFDDGKVNYNKIKEQEDYKISIARLKTAFEQGFNVALMCSEKRPEDCHRSKLIGETLADENLKIRHIDEKGRLKTHNEIMLRVTKGVNTKDLFGNSSLSSNGVYTGVNNLDYEFFTIGVYNSTEESFFQKLVKNSIDTFIDIRQRRGVRGAKYAYVNSNRLQERLNHLGIHYIYFKDLAPTTEIRDLQKEADLRAGIQKRDREFLGNTFVKEYQARVLDKFDFPSFFKVLNQTHSKRIILFCVEEKHTACHRSIVARRLQEEFNYHSKNL